MKYKVLACYDVVIEAFMPPQAVSDMLDEDIIESNRRAVLNGTIPADKAKNLVLYKVGIFDDKTGQFEYSLEKLVHLGSFVPRTVVEEVKTDGEQKN